MSEQTETGVFRGPARKIDKAALDRRVRADLWKAVWEASQLLDYDEIRAVVEGTLSETEADQP